MAPGFQETTQPAALLKAGSSLRIPILMTTMLRRQSDLKPVLELELENERALAMVAALMFSVP